MSVLLSCDAPNCPRTTLAIARDNRPTAPEGWIIVGHATGACIVSCSSAHFSEATATMNRILAPSARGRRASSGGAG